MHQIQFRLRLRPRSRWGAYSVPLSLLAGFGKREGKEERGGDGKGGEEGV